MRDTGIGMDQEALSRLFTPFTQFADSHARRGGGTGLGLVIAQKLVGLMGGKIIVMSSRGQGSIFSFTIDLPVAQVSSGTTTIKALRIESLRVLVAEDNIVNQTVVAAMLRQLGHVATLVKDGRAALDALAVNEFDLVLMDCNMPVMAGDRIDRERDGRRSRTVPRGRDERLPLETRDPRGAAGRDGEVPREGSGDQRKLAPLRARDRLIYFSAASISESSLAENSRLLSAPTASSTCETLLAPISDDVTTLLRSVQATAICASD
jgi:hypothetical protein